MSLHRASDAVDCVLDTAKRVIDPDARLVPLKVLRDLLPNLLIAIDVEVVAAMTGLSVSAVWAKCNRDKPATFDPDFPQPRKHKSLRRTVWSLTEVQGYLRELFTDPGKICETAASLRDAKSATSKTSRANRRGVKGKA